MMHHYHLLVAALIIIIVIITVSSSLISAAASSSLTSTCLASGSGTKISSFPTFSPNEITLDSIDTAAILQQRGCSPSFPWRYSVSSTPPPSISDQQLNLPNTLSTWSVDSLSGLVKFSAGSIEGVHTIVEKLECTSVSNDDRKQSALDACVITHQVMVYNPNLLKPTESPQQQQTTNSAQQQTTASSSSSNNNNNIHQNHLGPCSPVYGFRVSTSPEDLAKGPFTGSLNGFSGETECPTGLASSYQLVQSPSKSSSSSSFSLVASTGAFSYSLPSSVENTFDRDFFRFTKFCGDFAYCSSAAYLQLGPSSYDDSNDNGAGTSPAPQQQQTVPQCPDVYYFTTNQALNLKSVNGGFTCSNSNDNLRFSTFNNMITISDPSSGAFAVNQNNNNNGDPIPTNAVGWTDFAFTAECRSSDVSTTTSSCIGSAHLMVLPQSTTTQQPGNGNSCPTVSQRWSPSLTTPLSLKGDNDNNDNNNNCIFTITSQPDFLSVALDQSSGDFRITFADSVKNPVGWMLLSYDKTCSASSTPSCHGLAYIQALPATTAAPTTPAAPTTTSACPSNRQQRQVFYWNNNNNNNFFQLATSSSCTNFKIDYDNTPRPIPAITLSTASGLFTLSSSSAASPPQGGWTNFTFMFTCGDFDASLCSGSAAVWVQPTVTAPSPNVPSTSDPSASLYPVCASSNINFLFSYIWTLGTTQALNLKSTGNNQGNNASLVESTSSSVCSNFNRFDNNDDDDTLFALDSSTGVVTLNTTYNKNIFPGWKQSSLLVSCQSPQVFTCVTRLSILMMTPAAHTNPPPPTTTAAPTTSSTTTSSDNISGGGGGVVIPSPSSTSSASPSTTSSAQQQGPSTTIAAPVPPTPAPSPFLSTFANFQCSGTCNQDAWKTVSFVPDLWDVSPPGGVTLDPSGNNKDVTNPPHIQRTDGRPIDDISANYDALSNPEKLSLSATGEIGNMGVRFPTFESLSTATTSGSEGTSSTDSALPGRLTSSNVLSRVSRSSVPFDVDCLDEQSAFNGVGEQIWKWDNLNQLQGHAVDGEYNAGASNYYHKFGGKHEQCNTMVSRNNSCKYSPLVTPTTSSASASQWSLDVTGCDLTWSAPSLDGAALANNLNKKNGAKVFTSTERQQQNGNSNNNNQISSSSNSVVDYEATIFSEAIKPASWTVPAKGSLILSTAYQLPIRLAQWLTAKRDGANAHRTSFAVRGLTMDNNNNNQKQQQASPSSSSSAMYSFTLQLVAPSSVGSVFAPAIRGIEVDSISLNNNKLTCQYKSNAAFENIVKTANKNYERAVFPLPAALFGGDNGSVECTPATLSNDGSISSIRIVPVSHNIVNQPGDANTTVFTATAEPVTTFRVEVVTTAVNNNEFFQGAIAIRLLLSSSNSVDMFWIERYIIEGGVSVSGLSRSSTSTTLQKSAVPPSTSDAIKSIQISSCSGGAIVLPSEIDKKIVMGEDEKSEEELSDEAFFADSGSKSSAKNKRILKTPFTSVSQLGSRVCRSTPSSGAVIAGSDSFTIAAASTMMSSSNSAIVPEFDYLIVSQVGGGSSSDGGNNFRIAVISSSSSSSDNNNVFPSISKVAPFAPVTFHQSNFTNSITAVSINNIGSLCPRSNRAEKSCRLRFDVSVKSSSSSSSASSSSSSASSYSQSIFVFIDNELDSLALDNTASWQTTIDQLPVSLITPPVVTRISESDAIGYGAILAAVGAIALVAVIVIYIDKKSAQSAVKNIFINQPLKVAEFIGDIMFKSNNVKFSDEQEYELGNKKKDLSPTTADKNKKGTTEEPSSSATDNNKKPASPTDKKTFMEEMQEKADIAIEDARRANTPPGRRSDSPNASIKKKTDVPSIIGIPGTSPKSSSKFGPANDDDDLISSSSPEANDRHQKEQREKKQKSRQQQQQQKPSAEEASSNKDDVDPLYSSP